MEFGTDRLRRRNQKSEGQGGTWYDVEPFLGSDVTRRRQNESSGCDIGGGQGSVQRIRVSFLPLTFFVFILVNE